jgi:very-short-patch-repair endonuclease
MSREIPFEKSFASHEKSKYWSDKNELKPKDVFKGTHKKYLFNCNICNHEFYGQISCISKGTWCSYCSNNKLCDNNNCIICFDKSFASHEKSIYWNNENKLKPREIFKYCNEKFKFNCNCGHIFEKSLNIINKGSWCPYCCIPSQKICDNNNCNKCFENSFASHEKSVYWSNKNKEIPRNINKNSENLYYFDCLCGHEIYMRLHNINQGSWCYYCSGHKLCNNNDCKDCFNKSFASHIKSKYWSNKNKEIQRDVFKYSAKKYYFFCDTCNHNIYRGLETMKNENHCNYCVIPSKLLCNDKNCTECFNKSFASYEKSKYWSDKNKENPREIFLNTNKKYLFNCNKCNHEFESSVSHISNGKWYSYCNGFKLCNNNDCKDCFNKSFASHDKSIYWSDKNKLKPRQICKGSDEKIIFNCNICNNEYISRLAHIGINNRWCPCTFNKTEQKLYDKMFLIYPELIKQYKVEWCKNITYLPFDFCIEEYKIIIELDGRQHFEQVSNWNSPEDNQQRDKFKMKCANDNYYSVIRILQEDVFYDTFDWINKIKQAIQKIIDDKIIQNILICKNNEYDIFNDF